CSTVTGVLETTGAGGEGSVDRADATPKPTAANTATAAKFLQMRIKCPLYEFPRNRLSRREVLSCSATNDVRTVLVGLVR
ncbi:hypothetical protein, partial [Raoultella terrigena]|uniref:hypothetical protein n=1 Tax=Raoultella terrigena TaxID=577 RepID=UPI001C708466